MPVRKMLARREGEVLVVWPRFEPLSVVRAVVRTSTAAATATGCYTGNIAKELGLGGIKREPRMVFLTSVSEAWDGAVRRVTSELAVSRPAE